MRIIAISDIQGQPDWKQIATNETFDKIVLMGEDFETHEGITFHYQQINFIELLVHIERKNSRLSSL